jgi:hypothetical protein
MAASARTPASMKAAMTVRPADRRAGSRRFCSEHSGCEFLQDPAIICIALWRSLSTSLAVGRDPIANQVRRQRLDGHRMRIEAVPKPVKVIFQRRNDGGLGVASCGGIRFR